jgi:hypothetical protein
LSSSSSTWASNARRLRLTEAGPTGPSRTYQYKIITSGIPALARPQEAESEEQMIANSTSIQCGPHDSAAAVICAEQTAPASRGSPERRTRVGSAKRGRGQTIEFHRQSAVTAQKGRSS